MHQSIRCSDRAQSVIGPNQVQERMGSLLYSNEVTRKDIQVCDDSKQKGRSHTRKLQELEAFRVNYDIDTSTPYHLRRAESRASMKASVRSHLSQPSLQQDQLTPLCSPNPALDLRSSSPSPIAASPQHLNVLKHSGSAMSLVRPTFKTTTATTSTSKPAFLRTFQLLLHR